MQLTLFGRFSFFNKHHQVGLQKLQDSRKLQELLAYLIIHAAHPVSREQIAAEVWNEHPASQAHAYACKALTRLKAILDQEKLNFRDDAGHVQWDRNSDLWVDVQAFEAIFAEVSSGSAKPLTRQCLVPLLAGVDLYRGPLLDGFYSAWCVEMRNCLEQKFLQFLDILMDACENLGDYDSGITCGLRAIPLEHSREGTHQRLMRLFYLAGDRTSALRQYQCCTEALEEDLNIPPGNETVALYRQLQSGGQLPLSPPGTLPSSLYKTLTNLHTLDQVVSQLQALAIGAPAAIHPASRS